MGKYQRKAFNDEDKTRLLDHHYVLDNYIYIAQKYKEEVPESLHVKLKNDESGLIAQILNFLKFY